METIQASFSRSLRENLVQPENLAFLMNLSAQTPAVGVVAFKFYFRPAYYLK
jgi:hypothetical protein